MAKYGVGDRFLTTITAVDDTGMGTVYTLDDVILANDMQLEQMEMQYVPFQQETESPVEEKKTYTSQDLLERISRANTILNELIKTYIEVTTTVNHIPDIDDRLEELSL